MRSFNNLYSYPVSTMLVADDVVEFHAARILLLLNICGKKNRLDGLTKLAKLDFFVRYPEFFKQVAGIRRISKPKNIESPMIRHFYGPWDSRYYHVLAYLEARNLVAISKAGPKTFRFELTPAGIDASVKIRESESFEELVEHMTAVSNALSSMTGNALKKLVYQKRIW